MRYPYRKYGALYFMQIKPFIPTIRIIEKQTDLQLNSAEWCYLKIGNSGCVPFWGLRRNLPASLLKLVHGTGNADKTCRLAWPQFNLFFDRLDAADEIIVNLNRHWLSRQRMLSHFISKEFSLLCVITNSSIYLYEK